MKKVSLVALLALGVVGVGNGCHCGGEAQDPLAVLGDGFAGVTPVDANTVLVRFSENIDKGSVGGAFTVSDYTQVPPVDVDVVHTPLTHD